MKGFLSKHNWWFYFILTFAISWSVWGLYYTNGWGGDQSLAGLLIYCVPLSMILTKGKLAYIKNEIGI